MGLAITLGLLAAGVFLMWLGLTGTPALAALGAILAPAKAKAKSKSKAAK